jgi:type IV pilus assembly protein PilB
MADTDLIPAGGRRPYRSNLAQGLVKSGLITAHQLDLALAKQARTGDRLETVVVAMGLATETDVARVLAKQLNVPFMELSVTRLDPELAKALPGFVAEQHQVVVVGQDTSTLTVAMADPIDILAIDNIRLMTGRTIQVVVATPSEVKQALSRVYSADYHLQMLLDEIETVTGVPGAAGSLTGRAASRPDDCPRLPEQDVNEAPINRLVNLILHRALTGEADEIHVEPFGAQLRVRLRRDGILHTDMAAPAVARQAIINRIKVLASLPLGDSRSPRTTRFRMNIASRDVDIRVSCLPTASGEKFCLRLLDSSTARRQLGELGFDDAGLARFQRIITAGSGTLLVAGPHDSGKTTSLYAAVEILARSPERQIMSIENPVEHEIPGVAQLNCRPDEGFGWADAFSAAMVQSPDAIMVAELVDAEVAELAARASSEGRLVLASLAALDTAGAIDRLLQLGQTRARIATTVSIIQTQRLVRLLCRACRTEWKPDMDLIDRVGLDAKTMRRLDVPGQDPRSPTLYRAEGCPQCRETGYRGRTAVIECLELSRKVQQALRRGRPAAELIRAGQAEGMLSLRDAVQRRALAGETSAGEALRLLRA